MWKRMRPELVSPRTISVIAGDTPAGFRPWVEVAALVRTSVAAWSLSEEAWVHWALPVVKGSPDGTGAVLFDAGRRAASPGQPAAHLRLDDVELDDAAVGRLCETLISAWRPTVHYNPVLRLASRIDEPLEGFRRWCASLVSRAGGGGNLPPDGAVAARVGGAIETRQLGAGDLEVLRLRAGVAWYPDGVEPAPAAFARS